MKTAIEIGCLNNKFQEDIGRSERMIKRIKDGVEEELTRINEQMRLTGENIEKTKTDMEEIDYDTKTNTFRKKKVRNVSTSGK